MRVAKAFMKDGLGRIVDSVSLRALCSREDHEANANVYRKFISHFLGQGEELMKADSGISSK